MLVSKNGCGRQHRGLLAFHDRFESSAHCDFGFAVTYVSAQKAIHRSRFLHVMLYIFDCRFLIGSQDIFKPIFKLALPGCVGSESITTYKFALRIQSQEFVSHVAHCALRFGFGLLPAKSSQAIQRWLMTFGTRITLH